MHIESLFHKGPETSFEFDDHDWHTAQCRRRDYECNIFSPSTPPPPTHPAPSIDCYCGFYAWKDRSGIAKAQPMSCASNSSVVYGAQVVARVELAGRVILCDFGYRAERMRIAAWWPLEVWSMTLARTKRQMPSLLQDWVLTFARIQNAGMRCHHCGLAGCCLHNGDTYCRMCKRSSREAGCWYDVFRKAQRSH